MFLYVFIILVYTATCATQDACPEGMFGNNCALTCHCPSNLPCNRTTGQCGTSNICAKSYSTPNGSKIYCQRGDIAYKKKTSASSSYDASKNWLHKYVVDDDELNEEERKRCYESARRWKLRGRWLQVDLGKPYILKWMRLRRRFGCFGCFQIFSRLYIYLSNITMTKTTDLPYIGFKECFQFNRRPLDERNGYINIECTSTPLIPTAARFVIVYLHGPRFQSLTFCHLNVYECSRGTFGKTCGVCNCLNINEACNPVTGACTSGCRNGYTGTACQIKCSDVQKFGQNCVLSCHCKNNSGCDPISGSCSSQLAGGCAAGWKSESSETNCQKRCESSKFGEGCQHTCHCINNTQCNKQTGLCEGPNNGCAKGWTIRLFSYSCQTACAPGTYGPGCQFKCQCARRGCNRFTGACDKYGGCRSGQMSSQGRRDCRIPCPDRKFGTDCKSNCNCNDPKEVCNKVTGNCASGCRDGKIPPSCIRNCPDGKYGKPNCGEVCRCDSKENRCDELTGHCLHGAPCIIGFVGGDCQTKCGPGKYGINCTKTCACKDNKEVCLFDSGDCPISGRLESNNRQETTESIPSNTGVPSYVVGIIVAWQCVLSIAVIVIVVVYFRRRQSRCARTSTKSSNSKYSEPQINDEALEMTQPPARQSHFARTSTKSSNSEPQKNDEALAMKQPLARPTTDASCEGFTAKNWPKRGPYTALEWELLPAGDDDI